MLIAAFDIGKHNLAFCIEEARNVQENMNLEEVCNKGKIILFKNGSLMRNCDKKKYLDTEVFHNLTELLDENMEMWKKCDVFLIEQQMNRNVMALKIGQHCFSYFLFKFGRQKQVIEFPSYNKTHVLGAPRIQTNKNLKNGTVKTTSRLMTKPERKKWSVKKTIEILNDRNDTQSLEIMKKIKKLDDITDCFLMIQAHKFLLIKTNE